MITNCCYGHSEHRIGIERIETMMMIKRVMMLAAWAFVACCPSIVNSFVYRSAKFAYNANSMLDKRVKVGKTTGAPSGKTVDGAGVGRSSGGVAIEGKVRIPRVPSALDPEGVTRRVDSLLHILGKGEDGEVSMYVKVCM